jgi:phytoene synthase
MGAPQVNVVPPIQTACGVVRAGLASAAARMRGAGLTVGEPQGQLLRPLVAYAALSPARRAQVDDRFWLGALAIQMVHEASLLHDDIVDGAETRRGARTLAAREGAAAALVLGDHLLTGAYRVAAAAELPSFLLAFIHGVERTVAGEIAQQRGVGRAVAPPEYREAIEGKSGGLFGAAMALATAWSAEEGPAFDPESAGRRIGALYQMVDDALDYCPSGETGKPALQDYSQKKWTFVLDSAGLSGFALEPSEVVDLLFDPTREDGMKRVLGRLESEARETLECLSHLDGLLADVLESWVDRARVAIETERSALESGRRRPSGARASVEAEVADLARAIGDARHWGRYFGVHSKSFRFAARLFPPEPRRSVEGVYAFCRFTDDLVDETDVDPERARARLEAWRSLSRAAYDGTATGVPLADIVMGEAAREGVPFHYPDELLAGVAMDLDPVCFHRLSDLEVYTYRVASVVGGWVTELFGVRDPAVLARAYGLGHAMQITNILRDVGEDWRSDRLYLPRDLMEVHGVDPAMVDFVASGRGPVPGAYVELCEALMTIADRHYEGAFGALPDLPPFFARPVAVAARVYQGIHGEIRRTGYDNGTRRAYTRLTRKLRLAVGGLADLRRSTAARHAPGLQPARHPAKAE